MVEEATRYVAVKKRPNPWVILLIVLIHLGIFYVLIRSLAPTVVASVEDTVVSAFTVTVTAPDEPEEQAPEPEGAQGDPGKDAVAKPVTAPTPKIPVRRDDPAPRAASTGTADTSGARDDGDGTGAAGSGLGTGSGNSGTGRGGGAVTKPEIISGTLNSARDFPVPPGGREARIGTSVIVKVTVLPDGRATNCSVYRPSPFPDTDAAVCRLVVERLRFRPATNAAGEPVAAPFYYQQRFFN
ncbi:energy transducer TonB [Qipengyuania sp. 6B39]|uniref:TonB family protein n=1 Tax=Qipengyuania proteolytica TaxID=2867239 RepID=UPI001C89DE5D|nr:TonB family protein [Qipengyuania proteolytica]MBX7497055.1 energy transducer TonB [Qipengyuania proteolytica]